MKMTFEEKQYESQMNIQLACELNLHKNLFVPGQVLENSLGFDVALFSCNRKFWKYFYRDWDYMFRYWYKYWRHGMDIDDLRDMNRVFEEIYNHMPDTRYNLFIQYKRPKYRKSKKASEYWKWGRPYFRYKINEQQQKLLENLHNKVGNYGLVIYASPAFITQDEFWQNVNNKTLIENSNFCKAIELKGHYRYTYINGGRFGFAFSEPEEIKNIDLKKEINSLKESPKIIEGNNVDHIVSLANDLENIVKESDFNEFYKMRLNILKESEVYSKLDSKLFISSYKIKLFEEVTGIEIFNGF
jgi:hypothetical protein